LITLVLGGTRSGKSAVAERLVSGLGAGAGVGAPVTYVATMLVDDPVGVNDVDPDLSARVRTHRARRPEWWTTVEMGREDDLAEVLRSVSGSVLLDSLGPWVASLLFEPALTQERRFEALCRALAVRDGDTVVVTEEVGFGVHPSSESGRVFRDVLGTLNRTVADVADEVLFVIAGRTLRLSDLPGTS
jgi:adenosyl cobinamide kinase/adenosyl cobinamide phosphate guanylyltransferase